MSGEAYWDPGLTQDLIAALLGNCFAGARRGVGRSVSFEIPGFGA